jgi:O-antigen/teichoic acid export membrane protein
MSLARRALSLMAAKTVAFALTFALPLLLVRTLSQTEFGLYKQVFLLVGSGIAILPLGFVMSAFYFLPRNRDRQPGIVCNILLFYIVVGALAALVLVAQPRILEMMFHDPALAGLARPIAAVVFLMIVFSFTELLALASGEVRAATALIVVSNLTKTLLLAGAALVVRSFEAILAAAIVQGLLQAALLLWYLNSRFPGFWRGPARSLIRAQLAYALPLGTTAVLLVAQNDLHSYFVAHYFDAATYAIYAVGCFQLPMLSILSESVGSVMIPAVSRLELEQRSGEIVRLSARLMRALAAIHFPLYAVLLISGRDLIAVLFTTRYADAWPIFAVNLTLVPLGILASVSDPVLRAYPRYIPALLRVRAGPLGVLALGAWLATSHGWLLGAIVVMVVITAADRVALAVILGRALQVSRRDLRLLADVGKLAAAAALAGVVTAGVHALLAGAPAFAALAVTTVVFSLAYLAMVAALRIPTPEEWRTAREATGRILRRGARPGRIGLHRVRDEAAR